MVKIRHFESRDEGAVKKLITGVMNGEFQDEKAAFSFEDLDQVGKAYGGLGEAFFVAEDGRDIVGTVGVKREDDQVALIRRIFVAPDYRKKKIGLRLLNRAIEFCQEVGYQELIFKSTSKMTHAIELFRKRGFQPRAKVPMGQLELWKLSFSLRGKS